MKDSMVAQTTAPKLDAKTQSHLAKKMVYDYESVPEGDLLSLVPVNIRINATRGIMILYPIRILGISPDRIAL